MVDTTELTQLSNWMKENGVLHLKSQGHEILFGAGHLPAPNKPISNEKPKRVVSDAELLFAATEGIQEDA